MNFAAQPTPNDDQFETVTVTYSLRSGDGSAAAVIHEDLDLEDARALAEQILWACKIVEGES